MSRAHGVCRNMVSMPGCHRGYTSSRKHPDCDVSTCRDRYPETAAVQGMGPPCTEPSRTSSSRLPDGMNVTPMTSPGTRVGPKDKGVSCCSHSGKRPDPRMSLSPSSLIKRLRIIMTHSAAAQPCWPSPMHPPPVKGLMASGHWPVGDARSATDNLQPGIPQLLHPCGGRGRLGWPGVFDIRVPGAAGTAAAVFWLGS